MDRTSWIALIVGMLFLLVGYPALVQKFYPTPVPTPQTPSAEVQQAPTSLPRTEASPILRSAVEPVIRQKGLPEEKVVSLSNTLMSVDFTTHGGGVKRVELKKHEADPGNPLVFNHSYELPIFNIQGWDGDVSLVGYELLRQTDKSVSFQRVLPNGLLLRRDFELTDSYVIKLNQTLSNPLNEAIRLPYSMIQVGLGQPIHLKSEERRYLGGAWMTASQNFKSHKLPEFDSSNFILWRTAGKTLIQSPHDERILWASSKSQFFALLVATLDEPALGVELRRVTLPELKNQAGWIPDAVQTQLVMAPLEVEANKSLERRFELFAGPKENYRLKALPYAQNKIMEFGWLEPLCNPLLAFMNFLYRWVGNYGVSIILLTIVIKAILWYPQSRANRSMKQMQLLAPKLKDVQEKHKDNPQKMQEELMKLYQDYQVNPLGGCLPILVQMPIFIALYYMLMSAVELRHSGFLWIGDLSQPDTLFTIPIPGFELPFNLMPLIMAGTMYWSMSLTPQPEGVQNPNMAILKFMPILMLVICYNFSSALSLYWTMQNILSAVQMIYNLRQPMPTLEKKPRKKPIRSIFDRPIKKK